jgi:catechol 2,3-dioxygenase-like lactoylglutathione lyase family enzyme
VTDKFFLGRGTLRVPTSTSALPPGAVSRWHCPGEKGRQSAHRRSKSRDPLFRNLRLFMVESCVEGLTLYVRLRTDRRSGRAYNTLMTTTPNRTRITQIATVFVPMSNQDRALEFYLDKLGFQKRVDFMYGGVHRWIEVAPPGSTNSIALVPPGEGRSAAGDRTYCAFTTTDVESDHATLRARGVDVDAKIARKGTARPGLISTEVSVADPVPPQFFFRDIDGNRFLIVDPG